MQVFPVLNQYSHFIVTISDESNIEAIFIPSTTNITNIDLLIGYGHKVFSKPKKYLTVNLISLLNW